MNNNTLNAISNNYDDYENFKSNMQRDDILLWFQKKLNRFNSYII